MAIKFTNETPEQVFERKMEELMCTGSAVCKEKRDIDFQRKFIMSCMEDLGVTEEYADELVNEIIDVFRKRNMASVTLTSAFLVYAYMLMVQKA